MLKLTPSALLLLAAAAVSAALPWIAPRRSEAAGHAGFEGFPSRIDGRTVTPLEMSPREAAFARDFPGRIGRFTDGEREIIVRWVARPTRRLHPAADCLRGIGYAVTPAPMRRTADGQLQSCVRAVKGGDRLVVCEHVGNGAGRSWPDVSAWYWHALLAGEGGSWWSVVVAQPDRPEGSE